MLQFFWTSGSGKKAYENVKWPPKVECIAAGNNTACELERCWLLTCPCSRRGDFLKIRQSIPAIKEINHVKTVFSCTFVFKGSHFLLMRFQWKQQKQTQPCTGTWYLFSFKLTTFCTAPEDVRRDRIYIWFYFSDHRIFFPSLLFFCIWSSSKTDDLLMLGLLSWKVVFKC